MTKNRRSGGRGALRGACRTSGRGLEISGLAALGAFAGRGLRAARPASALGLRRAGLPQKLAGYQRQLVEGAGRSRRVR